MRQLALLALALALSGCSTQTVSPVMSGRLTTSQTQGARTTPASTKLKGWISKDSISGKPLLYVAGTNNCACVRIYRQDTGALVGLLTDGLEDPESVATDDAGNVYVANHGLIGISDIIVFPAGSISEKTYLYDSQVPADVVVAHDGTVFVSNVGNTPSIFAYAPGKQLPKYQLFDTNALQGFGITLDGKGNLFWGYIDGMQVGHVDKFVHAKGKPINLGISLGHGPPFMEFDNENRLIVSQPGPPAIDVFTLPNALTFQFGEIGTPYGVTLNRIHHNLFVSDLNAAQIDVYSYPSGVLKRTIPTAGFFPRGLALSPSP